MQKKNSFVLCLGLMVLLPGIALADAISPNITSGGKVYSEERPQKDFFGTGMSGRLSEASYLRFTGEHSFDDGDVETAIKKLGKAVHLDPNDPTGHVLYARAMTSKLNQQLRKGTPAVDKELLSECLEEWKLLWRHDADTSEQMEAKGQARRLMRVMKVMAKEESETPAAPNSAKLAAGKEKVNRKVAEKEPFKFD
ncbi:MAG: hypothetical protein IAF58_00685 [Leptolyngbya sp.]|nr:hypothetical protein [Candidatus Melainabacteria bacterium]